MSDDSKAINPLLSQFARAEQASAAAPKEKEKIGQEEFLSMLVAQLKNQDPLDPMKGDQFAVNLAQFSQLEQLIQINEKIGGGDNTTDSSSLAGFLGQEVTLNSATTTVANGDGGRVAFQLVNPSQEVKVELVDFTGAVRETITLENVDAGRQSVALSDLDIPAGEYNIRVQAKNAGGEFQPIPANAGGIVTGFVPGADPVLLVGEREVRVSDIIRVNAPAGG